MSHQPIPVERLRAALDAWGLADADVVEPIPPGATADVFLVQRGDERWVAKYAYQETWHFDAGLAVSEVLDVGGWEVARPVRTTTDGARYRLVAWPDGHDHPLALLRWVDGSVLDAEQPGHIECKATVCGRVHAQLLHLDPASVGVEIPRPHEPPEPLQSWNLGPNQWLDDLFVEVRQQTIEWRSRVRSCVGVWDGPDVRIRDDGGIGLLDFGHTTWQPLVNVVANRSLHGEDQGVASLDRFLDAVQRELPLTRDELLALDSFRRYNAAIYARWASMQVHEQGDESIAGWLASLVRFLRSDPPT